MSLTNSTSSPVSNAHNRLSRDGFNDIAPAVNKALYAMGKAIDDSGLEKELSELIKLRASQINGCAFCVQYHLNVARELRIPQTKLDLIAVWQEAGVFSAREMAAFAWTETLTNIAGNGVSESAYAVVKLQFSDAELPFLTAAVTAINSWNRIAVAFNYAPPAPVFSNKIE
ncbi:carboxymuconolactone decarboxylase family protein [Solimicrobium silvestre]|uniref:Alkylhydroperoxidase AhpD family core domain n=1 Tax=Solimicrobium silvestre TaxID=2099400 RepID=A0A2S9GWM9_9BURK|nr:carboxymuconolactone decarboxylase family protein [Solimicrobium silvestre]PRC92135.1 Alkylhydroperoxidase AhpD family core domain [Solimicrobium silvestre]